MNKCNYYKLGGLNMVGKSFLKFKKKLTFLVIQISDMG